MIKNTVEMEMENVSISIVYKYISWCDDECDWQQEKYFIHVALEAAWGWLKHTYHKPTHTKLHNH